MINSFNEYEKAKTELRIVRIQNSSNYSHDDIEQSLLQYRRANNIFEVGDKVLRADMEQNAIFTIVDKSILNDKEIIFCSINDLTYCFYSSILRHATDEEIKAGKRL